VFISLFPNSDCYDGMTRPHVADRDGLKIAAVNALNKQSRAAVKWYPATGFRSGLKWSNVTLMLLTDLKCNLVHKCENQMRQQ
jgi:hypothetical protein